MTGTKQVRRKFMLMRVVCADTVDERSDSLHRPAPLLDPTRAGSDDQRLTQRMRVPRVTPLRSNGNAPMSKVRAFLLHLRGELSCIGDVLFDGRRLLGTLHPKRRSATAVGILHVHLH